MDGLPSGKTKLSDAEIYKIFGAEFQEENTKKKETRARKKQEAKKALMFGIVED